MRVELKRLQERLGTTMIFVTHDQAEAMILSHRVAVMDAGRVVQVGTPEEVYRRPATSFVARFLGRANFLPGVVARREAAGVVVALDGGLSVLASPRDGLAPGERVQVAIRQEAIRLARAGVAAGIGAARADGASTAPANRAAVTVAFHAFGGQAHHYVVQLADGRELEIAAPGGDLPLERGASAVAEWAPQDVMILAQAPAGDAAMATPGDAPEVRR